MVASDWLRRAGPCSVDRGCVASADKQKPEAQHHLLDPHLFRADNIETFQLAFESKEYLEQENVKKHKREGSTRIRSITEDREEEDR